jgi:transcriptional regulator with XRE-family HTH domain
MAHRPRDQRPSRVYRSTDQFTTEAKALGRRIRELRKARGWTLYQASDAIDIDLKHFQRLEVGELNVTLVTLVRVARGLRVRLMDLFSETMPELHDTPIA